MSTELITNGQFETDLTGWTGDGSPVTLERNTSFPIAGTGDMHFLGNATNQSGVIGSSFSVTKGRTYQISFKYNKSGDQVRFKIGLVNTLTATALGGSEQVVLTDTDDVILYTNIFTATETDTTVFPIFFDNASQQGEFFVDEITVREYIIKDRHNTKGHLLLQITLSGRTLYLKRDDYTLITNFYEGLVLDWGGIDTARELTEGLSSFGDTRIKIANKRLQFMDESNEGERFSDLFDDFFFDSRPCKILQWFEGLAEDSAETLFSGEISLISFNEIEIEFLLRHKDEMSLIVPYNRVTKQEFPRAPEYNIGKAISIPIGSFNERTPIPAILTDINNIRLEISSFQLADDSLGTGNKILKWVEELNIYMELTAGNKSFTNNSTGANVILNSPVTGALTISPQVEGNDNEIDGTGGIDWEDTVDNDFATFATLDGGDPSFDLLELELGNIPEVGELDVSSSSNMKLIVKFGDIDKVSPDAQDAVTISVGAASSTLADSVKETTVELNFASSSFDTWAKLSSAQLRVLALNDWGVEVQEVFVEVNNIKIFYNIRPGKSLSVAPVVIFGNTGFGRTVARTKKVTKSPFDHITSDDNDYAISLNALEYGPWITGRNSLTAGNVISSFPYFIEWILRNLLAKTDDDIDEASFDTAHTALQDESGDITVFADNGTNETTVTSASHGLSNSDKIYQFGTESYNGQFIIKNVATNTYDIPIPFVANDATGSWTNGAYNPLGTIRTKASLSDHMNNILGQCKSRLFRNDDGKYFISTFDSTAAITFTDFKFDKDNNVSNLIIKQTDPSNIFNTIRIRYDKHPATGFFRKETSISLQQNYSGSRLAESLDASETGVDVDAGTDFANNDIILIDDEVMTVSSIASNTLTVVRNAKGSTAATHDDNTQIFILVTNSDDGTGTRDQNTSDPDDREDEAIQSLFKFRQLREMTLDADLISDDTTAVLLRNYLFDYYSVPHFIVEFDAYLNVSNLKISDIVEFDDSVMDSFLKLGGESWASKKFEIINIQRFGDIDYRIKAVEL